MAGKMANVGLLQIPQVEIPPLEQEGNLCQVSVEEIDTLLCDSHWSGAQSRRTVNFYVDLTFFPSKLSKQVRQCGKENKVQDMAPSMTPVPIRFTNALFWKWLCAAVMLGPCISVSHTIPEACQNGIVRRSCGVCPLASAYPGLPWLQETSLCTEQRQQHLDGDHQGGLWPRAGKHFGILGNFQFPSTTFLLLLLAVMLRGSRCWDWES